MEGSSKILSQKLIRNMVLKNSSDIPSDSMSNKLLIASIDIEVESHFSYTHGLQRNEIVSIATAFSYYKEKISHYKNVCVVDCDNIMDNPSDNTDINCYETEEELLLNWIDLIKKMDPDIITGWYIKEFDIKYLEKRFALHSIDFTPFYEFTKPKALYYNVGDHNYPYDKKRIIADMYTKQRPALYDVTTLYISGEIESVIDPNKAKLDDVSKLEKGMMIEIPDSDYQKPYTFGVDWGLPTFKFTIVNIDYSDNTVRLDANIPGHVRYRWRFIPIYHGIDPMNAYALENRPMLVKHVLYDAIAISKLIPNIDFLSWLDNIVKHADSNTTVSTMDEDYMTVEI